MSNIFKKARQIKKELIMSNGHIKHFCLILEDLKSLLSCTVYMTFVIIFILDVNYEYQLGGNAQDIVNVIVQLSILYVLMLMFFRSLRARYVMYNSFRKDVIKLIALIITGWICIADVENVFNILTPIMVVYLMLTFFRSRFELFNDSIIDLDYNTLMSWNPYLKTYITVLGQVNHYNRKLRNFVYGRKYFISKAWYLIDTSKVSDNIRHDIVTGSEELYATFDSQRRIEEYNNFIIYIPSDYNKSTKYYYGVIKALLINGTSINNIVFRSSNKLELNKSYEVLTIMSNRLKATRQERELISQVFEIGLVSSIAKEEVDYE
ncbi:MAG: hypothetical protein ACK5NK_04835 [Niabella sp.]